MIRQYLLLIRLPNAFTAPSNILTGYFAVVLPSHTNISNLSILMLSSALLYISGIVFNDYFDIEIDRKERPLRPLVTGIITSKKAFTIALAAMVAANVLVFTLPIILWKNTGQIYCVLTYLTLTILLRDLVSQAIK